MVLYYELSSYFTANNGITRNSIKGVLNTKSARVIVSTDPGPRGFPEYQVYLSWAATI